MKRLPCAELGRERRRLRIFARLFWFSAAFGWLVVIPLLARSDLGPIGRVACLIVGIAVGFSFFLKGTLVR